MSIEAHVFTPETQPISIAELTKDMASVRVAARVLRNFHNWSHFDVVTSGNLEDGDILCGWLNGGSVASEIETSVFRHAQLAIEGFLLEGNFGACGLGIRDLSGMSSEELVDLSEVDGDELLAAAMRNAKFDYDAYSAAGRNDMSILLQFRVTQVIAKQRGGVWTDPVSGDYLIVGKGRLERLPCLVAFEEQSA